MARKALEPRLDKTCQSSPHAVPVMSLACVFGRDVTLSNRSSNLRLSTLLDIVRLAATLRCYEARGLIGKQAFTTHL